jgi:hypothetical protein
MFCYHFNHLQSLKLADQIQAWLNGILTWLPVGWADLVAMLTNKLSSLQRPQNLLGGTTNPHVIDRV